MKKLTQLWPYIEALKVLGTREITVKCGNCDCETRVFFMKRPYEAISMMAFLENEDAANNNMAKAEVSLDEVEAHSRNFIGS